MIPVELRINSISCVSLISFSLFCPLQLYRPGFLCRSVQLPKQGGKKSPKTGPELRAPPASAMESRWRFLLTAAGCSQQSRRGNFSFGVIHHRAWEQEEEEDRGRTDSPRPDTRCLASFKRLRIGTFMAHPRTHM